MQDQNLGTLNIQRKRMADSCSPPREAPSLRSQSRGQTPSITVSQAQRAAQLKTELFPPPGNSPSTPSNARGQTPSTAVSLSPQTAQLTQCMMSQQAAHTGIHATSFPANSFVLSKGNTFIVPKGMTVNVYATRVQLQNTSSISFTSIEHAAEYFGAQARLCGRRAAQAIQQKPPG